MSSTLFPVLASAKPRAASRAGSRFEVARCVLSAIVSLGCSWRWARYDGQLSLRFGLTMVSVVLAVCIAHQWDRVPDSPLAIDVTVRQLRSIAVAALFVLGDVLMFPHAHAFAVRGWVGFVALNLGVSLVLPAGVPSSVQRTPESAEARQAKSAIKRCFDVVFSTACLIVLSPLLVVIAIAVKVDSPGPVLFSQRRVGEGGKHFRIFKFRTMFSSAPAYERSPSDSHDARITRVGRVLRRLGADELPQLLNVLRGEMSVVGPRPEMPFVVRTYTEVQRRRLEAVPGITGLWQISPGRAQPIHENPQYDLYYIAHRSLLLDLAILVRTVSSVIRGVGAV